MRFGVALAVGGLAVLAGCRKQSAEQPADDSGFLSGASAEARQALADPVSFELTAENYARWETAQRNLDQVPASALPVAQGSGGSAVDRAVARLNASPPARHAIESAGLSVRDFVLETVALAQAMRAAESGSSSNAAGVSSANFAFMERFRDRVSRETVASELARESGDPAITDPNTAAELAAANRARIADSLSQLRDSSDQDTSASEIPPPAPDSSDTLEVVPPPSNL